MAKETLLYAQSGGVTAVINATAAAVITEARSHRVKVLAARNGILGALREDLIDTSKESITAIRALTHTPGGAFGSCRFKLKSLEADHDKYERLLEVFKAHNVRWFLYNGGNDSADTALKVSQLAKTFDYPLHCIGVPKTIDNDLAITDASPGFGSAAKYTAVSICEAARDVQPMARPQLRFSFTKQWAAMPVGSLRLHGLAGQGQAELATHHPLLNAPTTKQHFWRSPTGSRPGRLVRGVASEGIPAAMGASLPMLAAPLMPLVTRNLAASPLTSPAERNRHSDSKCTGRCQITYNAPQGTSPPKRYSEQAQAVGKAAVRYALEGMNAVMPVIGRTSDTPAPLSEIEPAALTKIANHEKPYQASFLRRDGFGISERARTVLLNH